jgi:dihydropteroate synthase
MRARTVSFSGEPLLMGIVNVSPDSFSDPGRRDLPAMVNLARDLVAAGAGLVDVGGESGRTDRSPVPESEEIARVVPLIERLTAEGFVVSVDTWRAPVARAALAGGASLVNDVSGLADPRVAEACAEVGGGLVITHTRIPPKRKAFPRYADVIADVASFLRERADEALQRGVAWEQIAFDPGLDLAKSPAQSIEVLRRLGEVHALGRPLLLAASRKDFVGALTDRRPRDRLAGTLATVGEAVDNGAVVLRVHDVAATRDYLRVRAALRGESRTPADMRLDDALRREPDEHEGRCVRARS